MLVSVLIFFNGPDNTQRLIVFVFEIKTLANRAAGQKPPIAGFGFDLLALTIVAPSTLPQSVGRQMGYPENLSKRREEMREFLGKRSGESLHKIQHISARESSQKLSDLCMSS